MIGLESDKNDILDAFICSPDTESDSVDVVFNLTNGNPDIMSKLPNITNLKQNSSVVVDIVPLGAGHVDVVAWPQGDLNIR